MEAKEKGITHQEKKEKSQLPEHIGTTRKMEQIGQLTIQSALKVSNLPSICWMPSQNMVNHMTSLSQVQISYNQCTELFLK